jgi:hypothetical protein
VIFRFNSLYGMARDLAIDYPGEAGHGNPGLFDLER